MTTASVCPLRLRPLFCTLKKTGRISLRSLQNSTPWTALKSLEPMTYRASTRTPGSGKGWRGDSVTASNVLGSSASTRRGSKFVVDAASLLIVASNVSARTGIGIGKCIALLFGVRGGERATSAIEGSSTTPPSSPSATAAPADTVARSAKPRTGPRATRRRARRETSIRTKF